MNHERLTGILDLHYGLKTLHIETQPGGWSALAFRVETTSRTVFLKVYDKRWASTPRWTKTIDVYIPVLQWMDQCTPLQNRLPQPVFTRRGGANVEDEQAIYLLYEYIEGSTIGDAPLNSLQVQTFAEITAELHGLQRAQLPLPLSVEPLALSYCVPYGRQFGSLFREGNQTWPQDLTDCLSTYSDRILRLGDFVDEQGQIIAQLGLPTVLCHTDLHPWNLMETSSGLVLIDWEGLAVAPLEADFMALIDRPYFEEFWETYCRQWPGTRLNSASLGYFRARRVLEDLWELVERVLVDQPAGSVRQNLLNDLQQALHELAPGPPC